jgi:hypothetical protein
MSDDPYTTEDYGKPKKSMRLVEGGRREDRKTTDHEHIKEHNTMAQMENRGHKDQYPLACPI